MLKTVDHLNKANDVEHEVTHFHMEQLEEEIQQFREMTMTKEETVPPSLAQTEPEITGTIGSSPVLPLPSDSASSMKPAAPKLHTW